MARTKYLSMVFIFCSLFAFAAQKAENKTNNEHEINLEGKNTLANARMPAAAVDPWFEKILSLNQARIGNSGQIVLVTNKAIESDQALIRTFEKKNGQWVEKFTTTAGTIGWAGFAPYTKKREGDGKTPTGVFYLGPVYGYPGVKVSTKMEYWVASANDYWIDAVTSKQYNRWVTSNIAPSVSHEEMKRADDKYKYGIAVQYNMDQVKGKGSVITVHVLVGNKNTSGCIAVPVMKLIEIIGWLDPVKKPLIIMGTVDELDTSPVSGPALDKNDKYIWKKEQYTPAVN
ncbi:MAG: L,D-transpeptidase family protein [Bacteroidales bacterium]|nr:L,D-transpeptidase family protein [Bacteroidales bacterium]